MFPGFDFRSSFLLFLFSLIISHFLDTLAWKLTRFSFTFRRLFVSILKITLRIVRFEQFSEKVVRRDYGSFSERKSPDYVDVLTMTYQKWVWYHSGYLTVHLLSEEHPHDSRTIHALPFAMQNLHHQVSLDSSQET